MFSARPIPNDLPAFLRRTSVVHELRAPAGAVSHAGLAVRMLAALPQNVPVLWVSAVPDWYPQGLAWAGLDPGRCLFVQAQGDAEVLAALETGLRGGMAGVGECGVLTRLAAKRLALAAKQGNALGLVLRFAPACTAQDSTAFASRWLVSPAPEGRMRAELLYAKGAMPGTYMFQLEEKQDEPTPLALPMLRRAG